MSDYYLFTRADGTKIEMKECSLSGREAEEYAYELREKLKHEVVAWCHMGGENDVPVI